MLGSTPDALAPQESSTVAARVKCLIPNAAGCPTKARRDGLAAAARRNRLQPRKRHPRNIATARAFASLPALLGFVSKPTSS